MNIITTVTINYFKSFESVTLDACTNVNALIGKNNSGKSSVLHALHMAGLGRNFQRWDAFQPKLDVQDMFTDAGPFSIELTFKDGQMLKVTSKNLETARLDPSPADAPELRTILIEPTTSVALMSREHVTPHQVMLMIENNNLAAVTALDLLHAIKYYAARQERGLTEADYHTLIAEIKQFFPDISEIASDRTDRDIATLTYSEYGKKLDILYTGSGLRHFLDVLVKTHVAKASVILLDEPEAGLHPELQRRFLDYLHELSSEKHAQIFIATQSPVLLNYVRDMNVYRVHNTSGKREIQRVPTDAMHTVLSDLGIRPSDLFNQDICMLVEGQSDVIFFDHVINTLYRDEFRRVGIAIQQYGGGAADGIISGAIDVSNITPAQKYTLWIRDRDAKPGDEPATNATKFKNKLAQVGLECHILKRREIEYYYPEVVHVSAQQSDQVKEHASKGILHGDQSRKFVRAAGAENVTVPRGKNLRRLLEQHLKKKEQLSEEIRNLVEHTLLTWKREILGENEGSGSAGEGRSPDV